MNAPLGVILAGGLATRMGGGDKCLKPLAGRRVLDHVIDRLSPQVDRLALNANGDAARFEAFDLPILADPIDGFPGPLAGVLAGLDWASEHGAETIVTVAADTPFFPCDLVPQLMLASEGMTRPLVLAATPRGTDDATKSMSRSGLIRHPTVGLWPVALRDDLRDSLRDGLRKVVIWTEKHDGREKVFEDEGDPFFNVNTPEDLAQANQMLEGAV